MPALLHVAVKKIEGRGAKQDAAADDGHDYILSLCMCAYESILMKSNCTSSSVHEDEAKRKKRIEYQTNFASSKSSRRLLRHLHMFSEMQLHLSFIV